MSALSAGELSRMSLLQHVTRFIDTSTDCWLWTGTITTRGYGAIRHGGKAITAHRAAYEAFVGPIPPGKYLDHLCRNRRCVRPDHLEPVTNRENWLRGENFMVANVGKTTCENGHEFTASNTYVRPGGRGRDCRACRLRQYHKRHPHRAPPTSTASPEPDRASPEVTVKENDNASR